MAYAAFFFSIMSLLVKVAGRHLPSQEIVFFRSIGTLILSWAGLQRIGYSPWGEQKTLLTLRGITGFLALLCFFYALTELPLGDATVIQYTNPVFTAILAAVFLGEAVKPIVVLSTVGSLTGVALITQPAILFGTASRLDPLAVGIGLLGAVLAAIAYVLVRQLRGQEHYLVIIFYFSLAGTVGALPITVPVFTWPFWWEWLVLAGIGIVTQIAQIYMTRGLHLEEAGRATAVGYLQLVFAFLWGMLFFAEFPDMWSIAGVVLVVICTFIVSRKRS
jgi:drug/metabolite transporter (DMT)-like permease